LKRRQVGTATQSFALNGLPVILGVHKERGIVVKKGYIGLGDLGDTVLPHWILNPASRFKEALFFCC
jgi:hypothetical protein